MPDRSRRAAGARFAAAVPLALALVVFLALAAYQLDLPGLHYDEAKEAGVNAMQLLRGQPVTAFRDATVALGPCRIPLMVQDYIGNLNVLLAVPFLAAGGVNTPALRALPIALAALTLFFAWKIARRLGGPVAAAVTALLLAVNPTFVFWSRQGIFVTNITALLLLAALWSGLVWWQERRPRDLVIASFLCGLGVYAKLLFVWAVVALVVVAVVAWLWERRGARKVRDAAESTRRLEPRLIPLALVAFAIPLVPLIIFNVRTGGTFTSIFGHLGRSYYGVDNSAYGSNLIARVEQVVTLLRGDHFWYLGELYADRFAPWLLLALVLLAGVCWLTGARRRAFTPLLPMALLGLIILQSAFTVSDLFITHFALVAPLPALIAGLSMGEVVSWAREWRAGGGARAVAAIAAPALAALLALGWCFSDAQVTLRYHRILTVSGGYSAHSDAIYRLTEYLDQKEYGSPVALDWGIDAPVRFLSEGRVQPVDVFGYERIDAPDEGFADRLAPYMTTWLTVYVAHAPDKAVFKGRVEAIYDTAMREGNDWMEEVRIAQRSGEPVFIIHRYLP